MKLQTLVLLCFTLTLITIFTPQAEGYYWRNFLGAFNNLTTEKAFVGVNYSGNSIYVGNAVVHGGVYIGEILKPLTTISIVGWNADDNKTKIMVSEDLIQILCFDEKDAFKWQATSSSDVFNLRDLVVGGAEIIGGNNQDMLELWVGLFDNRYIGQISSETGQMTVFTGDGTVHVYDEGFKALLCPGCIVY